ncbi:hypothetical protein JOB18_043069 [Solea senegalensis]|uniref:Uncharacterized protein n=1 Tax=Solea senegalensis TaxID=28829 RepID=A0AAV6QKW6_SOLSE|nr:hypothetical protein JOB18_043069 [Solea senegalensis]
MWCRAIIVNRADLSRHNRDDILSETPDAEFHAIAVFADGVEVKPVDVSVML